MKTQTIKLGKLEINLEELANFLVKAKKACWAGGGEEEIVMDSSKLLTFQKGNFHYTDNYAGYFQIAGNEFVRWRDFDGPRIWQMNYSGGMLPEFQGNKKLAKETDNFLREALSQVTPEAPFRGPLNNEERFLRTHCRGSYKDDKKDLIYEIIVLGDIKRFSGREEIEQTKNRNTIYSLTFHGGIIIPK